MARIEDLADIYGQHLATPWQRTVAGAQRVIMVAYDKELERVLRARKGEFETRTRAAGHDWHEIDVTSCFATWLAADDYREAFFKNPMALTPKIHPESGEFLGHVARQLSAVLTAPDVTDNAVVALFGVASLFGFARVSRLLETVERDIRGRLVVFFPGHFEQNNYRLLDARDGWNYMAVPISMQGTGGAA
jgi:hypothetical protein